MCSPAEQLGVLPPFPRKEPALCHVATIASAKAEYPLERCRKRRECLVFGPAVFQSDDRLFDVKALCTGILKKCKKL